MSFFRTRKSWPYAANSTGRHRGSLNLGFSVGRVEVYEAVGDARAIYMDRLGPEVVTFLNNNGGTLQESGNFVDLSLFMMGKSLYRTKPMLMFVSNDKNSRLEAFNMIKQSAIMEAYPGVGLGHMDLRAEFENLRPLADSVAYAGFTSWLVAAALKKHETEMKRLAAKAGSGVVHTRGPAAFAVTGNRIYTTPGEGLEGRRLLSQDSTPQTMPTQAATAGGVISYRGRYMLHTVNHFLERLEPPPAQARTVFPVSSTNDTNDCEVTGLSDFEDEDEDDLADITSRESRTPESVTSRSAPSPTNDGDTESIISLGSMTGQSATDQAEFVISLNKRLRELTLSENQTQTGPTPKRLLKVGEVIVSSKSLDFAVVELDGNFGFGQTELDKSASINNAIPLETYLDHIEKSPKDAAIRTTTPDGGTIGGILSGTSSYVRFPQGQTFQEIYIGRLNRPLVPGDCGSWIRDAISGKLYGHVVAGSPTTGLVMIIPARHSFAEALASVRTALGTATSLEHSHTSNMYNYSRQNSTHASRIKTSYKRYMERVHDSQSDTNNDKDKATTTPNPELAKYQTTTRRPLTLSGLVGNAGLLSNADDHGLVTSLNILRSLHLGMVQTGGRGDLPFTSHFDLSCHRSGQVWSNIKEPAELETGSWNLAYCLDHSRHPSPQYDASNYSAYQVSGVASTDVQRSYLGKDLARAAGWVGTTTQASRFPALSRNYNRLSDPLRWTALEFISPELVPELLPDNMYTTSYSDFMRHYRQDSCSSELIHNTFLDNIFVHGLGAMRYSWSAFHDIARFDLSQGLVPLARVSEYPQRGKRTSSQTHYPADLVDQAVGVANILSRIPNIPEPGRRSLSQHFNIQSAKIVVVYNSNKDSGDLLPLSEFGLARHRDSTRQARRGYSRDHMAPDRSGRFKCEHNDCSRQFPSAVELLRHKKDDHAQHGENPRFSAQGDTPQPQRGSLFHGIDPIRDRLREQHRDNMLQPRDGPWTTSIIA